MREKKNLSVSVYICCFSVVQSCLTLCDPMFCSIPGFPILHYLRCLLKLMSIESVMPSNHLILCSPLLLPPSNFPSIRVFSNESALHIRWPKYQSFLSFSSSTSPSSEYSGLISFRMDWLDLLAVQGTLKSLLQHCSSKASILWHLALFASLVAQLVKNPPVVRETWVQSLGWEDPLEKGTATHSSILAWRIPWTVQSMGLQRVGHD